MEFNVQLLHVLHAFVVVIFIWTKINVIITVNTREKKKQQQNIINIFIWETKTIKKKTLKFNLIFAEKLQIK